MVALAGKAEQRKKKKGAIGVREASKTRSQPLDLRIYHGFITKAMAAVEVS